MVSFQDSKSLAWQYQGSFLPNSAAEGMALIDESESKGKSC